jgi:hypothetical protein
MSAIRRLIVLLAALASTVLGVAGFGYSVNNPGGDAPHLVKLSHGVLHTDDVWLLELRSSSFLIAAGIALVAFVAVELSPDPRQQLRACKACGALGILLLPAPFLGMAASVLVARAEVKAFHLREPAEPEVTSSGILGDYPAIAVSAVGMTLGAIGVGLLLVAAWRGQRQRRAIVDMQSREQCHS